MRASETTKEQTPSTDTIKVLIADDDPPTRILLRAAISQWGYEVTEASNGEEAWQILQQPNAPRLLILDWLMPKLDGISLCERIKQEQIIHPYTILLTQVTGTTNIIKGLEAGADEFLSKPFNMAELRSRLSVGARIIRFENALAEQNTKVQNYASQMETLSQAHAKQLVYHSDLLSMLGSLIEKISHKIYEHFSKMQKGDQASSEDFQKVETLRQSIASIISIFKRLQVNSIYSPKSEVCNINELIQSALTISHCATHHVKVDLDLATPLPPLSADPELLQEVFLSLILSATEAIKDQNQPYLKIETKLTPKNAIEILIEDSGPHLTTSELEIIQRPQLLAQDLEQVRSRLSAALSKEIIHRYGGSLYLENIPGGGVCLYINLPLQMKHS
jgi:DNA-binding response OmpR family regulator